MTGALKWPLGSESHGGLPLFRRARDNSLRYPALAHDRCCHGSFLLDRQVSMLFELMRKIGGPPRCRPVLCGLRDRCIAAMLASREWSFLKDLHPDHSLIGRGSCCWTKEGKWYPSRDLRSARSIKSRLLRYQSLRGVKLASAAGFAPTHIRLRI
jgi:hypothetical protein